MAKKLVADLNVSGLNHLYLLEDNNIQPIRFGVLNDMYSSISDILEKEEVEDILIIGSQDYALGVGKEVLKNVLTNYSNKNVRVYVNDKVLN